MNAAADTYRTDDAGSLVRGLGLPGRTAVLGASAGGVLVGGFLVAALTLGGRLSAGGLLLTSSALFVVGAVLGFLHAGVLGYLGRPSELEPGEALGDLAKAILYTIPALAASWVVAGWIGNTLTALYLDRTLPLALTAAAWAVGAAALVAAAWQGARALANAYARWPQRRAGTVLTAGVFAALLVAFLVHHPEVWYLDVALNDVGAVLLATAATLWVGGPLVTVALRLRDRLPSPRPEPGLAGGWAANLGLGLVAGAALGLLSLPFHEAPLLVPTVSAGAGAVGALLAALSRALVDEVLLRLGVATALAWGVLRLFSVPRRAAAALAVGGAALVQIALYTPGVLAVGFPGTLAAMGYLLVGVLLPALTFGILYWTRGLGTAVVADATLLLTLAALA